MVGVVEHLQQGLESGHSAYVFGRTGAGARKANRIPDTGLRRKNGFDEELVRPKVSFSMLGGQLLASAWMLHKAPNGKLWMMPPIIATAGHGLAAMLNVRTMHRLSSDQY
jgi:hypothetical protein